MTIKIEGYGFLHGRNIDAEVVRETKTTITVKWGSGSKKFSKKTLQAMPSCYDIWSGYRLGEEYEKAR